MSSRNSVKSEVHHNFIVCHFGRYHCGSWTGNEVCCRHRKGNGIFAFFRTVDPKTIPEKYTHHGEYLSWHKGLAKCCQSDWQSTGYSCLAKYSSEKTANIFMMPLMVSSWNDDLVGASDWLKQIFHKAWPIRSTIQIWAAMHHQYGVSAFVSQTSFCRETSAGVLKYQLFSQANKKCEGFVSKETVVLW